MIPANSQYHILLIVCLIVSGTINDSPAQSRLLDKAKAERAQVDPDSPEPDQPVDRTETEGEEVVSPGDSTPLGVDIAAIRLISHQDKTDESPDLGSEKIEIDPEITAPTDLTVIVGPYLGQPASMALLEKLAKELIVAWRDGNYPVVDVYYPEQNITGGKLQIVVREAVLGQVEVEGAKHTKPGYLKKNVSLTPGDRIDKRILENDLDWLNQNPIRQVNLIYDRGEEEGTSDIILQALEKDPFTSYIGFGNTGIGLTGENEWTAGFNWANPFRTEQSIGYHFASDADFDSLRAHSIFYRSFLPWRHEFRILASHVQTDVFTEDDLFPSDLNGKSVQTTFEYRIPLPRVKSVDGLKHSFIAGLDYKSTNTDLLFGGLTALDSNVVIFQFRTQYEVEWPDKLGYTRLTVGSVFSPGDVLDGNDDAAFDLLREGATADYAYGFGELERGFKLPA